MPILLFNPVPQKNRMPRSGKVAGLLARVKLKLGSSLMRRIMQSSIARQEVVILKIIKYILLLLALLGTSTLNLSLAHTMPTMRITYVDSDTQQPIAGANVIFFLQAHRGTITGHGGRSRNLFITEGVTDQTGAVVFTAQKFYVLPLTYSYLNGPHIYMFKAGHEAIHDFNLGFSSVEQAIDWAGNGIRKYKVKKVSKIDDTWKALATAKSGIEDLYRVPSTDHCDWEKIPKFILAIERGRLAVLQNERESEVDVALHKQSEVARIDSPLENLAQYRKKQCKNPDKVFGISVPTED